MQLGLGVLQLPPERFWAMTTPEFKAAMDGYIRVLGGNVPEEGISREDFFAMQKMFPDEVC